MQEGFRVYKVFIDGREGTTGLRIYDRLLKRQDIELIILSENERKNPSSRKAAINACDAAFLCLPDQAARDAVEMLENPAVTVIDASTAHRTNAGWAYGFPELSENAKEKVLASKRIAVPGCHASGFIALVYPLIEAGLLQEDALLSCHSITGFSGGGKKMIASYAEAGEGFHAPRSYALSQEHKHLPEMTKITGLRSAPAFLPVVGNFYSGMLVTVPIHTSQLKSGAGLKEIREIYKEKFTGPVVSYRESLLEEGFLSAGMLSGKDAMWISCEGNEERIQLIAAYDNLGKGASGAAVQLLNMKMGADMTAGLVI